MAASTASNVTPRLTIRSFGRAVNISMPTSVPAPCAPNSHPSAGASGVKRSWVSSGKATCTGPLMSNVMAAM
ncbi:hypothetical protein D9M68_961720 [compost metagenome]